MTQADTLPAELPLFPLGGAILLPGEVLPLNVFEPRYLNMVDDVRRSGGHIGIIQTRPGGSPDLPELARIGGAGRLDSFQETEDGRYLITLTGVSRFALGAELDVATPYRIARADYHAFVRDLDPRPEVPADRTRLVGLLQGWFHAEGVGADWSSFDDAPINRIVDQLAMVAPFSSAERQRLLEAYDVAARLHLMEDIIAGRLADGASGSAH